MVKGGPNDGRTIILAKPTISMGRLPDNDVVVNEPAVSRRHAEIFRTDAGYQLRDLGTTNGTFVNGRNIESEPHPLMDGDQISLSRTDISFMFGLNTAKTIQIPRGEIPGQGVVLPGTLGQQTGSREERAAELQENLRQLEIAYQQASNLAQELAEEYASDNREEEESRQRVAAEAAREDERKRLAEELHDETMSDLAALSLEVGLLRRQAGKVSEGSPGDMRDVESSLAELGGRLKKTNVRLRQMVQGIFPSALTERGLVLALRSFMEDLAKRPIVSPEPLNLRFHVMGFDDDRLESDVEIGLYRVVQQGLNNAIQHAQAKNLVVGLTWGDDEITLSIADDGVGFDVENPEESPSSGHFGLSNLNDRMEAIQGTMEITSVPSEGTTLRATIPFKSGTTRSTETQTSGYLLKPAPPV